VRVKVVVGCSGCDGVVVGCGSGDVEVEVKFEVDANEEEDEAAAAVEEDEDDEDDEDEEEEEVVVEEEGDDWCRGVRFGKFVQSKILLTNAAFGPVSIRFG